MIDNGSQRTYLAEDLAAELKLRYCRTAKIKIIPFGGTQERIKTELFNRVEIIIKNQYDEQMVTIIATVVPRICNDVLPVPKIKTEPFNEICNKWADLVNCKTKPTDGINLIIGQNY